jgi:hypothetical protein
MLVIKDQEQAMDCGAGLPDGLPGITPREVAHTVCNARMYQEMGWYRKELADD